MGAIWARVRHRTAISASGPHRSSMKAAMVRASWSGSCTKAPTTRPSRAPSAPGRGRSSSTGMWAAPESAGRASRWRSGEEVTLAARRIARSLRQATDSGRTGDPAAPSGLKRSWKASRAPALAPRQP